MLYHAISHSPIQLVGLTNMILRTTPYLLLDILIYISYISQVRIESNDSPQLKSTRLTGSRFVRHWENIPQVTTKGRWKCCRIQRLVTVDVDPSCRKSIWKTLRKFPASGHERGLQVLSNRLESNDSSRLMSTRHTGSRFARYLENITQVVTKGGCRFSRIERIP